MRTSLTARRSLLGASALLLAASSLALLAPAEASAARRYGIIETETFYSDASLTTRVGRCVENSCTGQFYCTGTITDYSTYTIRAC